MFDFVPRFNFSIRIFLIQQSSTDYEDVKTSGMSEFVNFLSLNAIFILCSDLKNIYPK